MFKKILVVLLLTAVVVLGYLKSCADEQIYSCTGTVYSGYSDRSWSETRSLIIKTSAFNRVVYTTFSYYPDVRVNDEMIYAFNDTINNIDENLSFNRITKELVAQTKFTGFWEKFVGKCQPAKRD